MFVRFQGAVLLAVLAAIGGTSVENATLDRHRAVGRQHYRLEALLERVARLRLRSEELGAPSRLLGPARNEPARTAAGTARPPYGYDAPLLRWRVTPEPGR